MNWVDWPVGTRTSGEFDGVSVSTPPPALGSLNSIPNWNAPVCTDTPPGRARFTTVAGAPPTVARVPVFGSNPRPGADTGPRSTPGRGVGCVGVIIRGRAGVTTGAGGVEMPPEDSEGAGTGEPAPTRSAKDAVDEAPSASTAVNVMVVSPSSAPVIETVASVAEATETEAVAKPVLPDATDNLHCAAVVSSLSASVTETFFDSPTFTV